VYDNEVSVKLRFFHRYQSFGPKDHILVPRVGVCRLFCARIGAYLLLRVNLKSTVPATPSHGHFPCDVAKKCQCAVVPNYVSFSTGSCNFTSFWTVQNPFATVSCLRESDTRITVWARSHRIPSKVPSKPVIINLNHLRNLHFGYMA
jgi:hypothetical protein